MWGGHSCPPPFDFAFARVGTDTPVRAGGATLPLAFLGGECPFDSAQGFGKTGQAFSAAISLQDAFTGWLKAIP